MQPTAFHVTVPGGRWTGDACVRDFQLRPLSAADAIVDRDREALARTLWGDVAKALGIEAALPPWQIVKEKRATFAATPAQNAKRPDSRTRWVNVVLAGDWIQTGLPATIEGAVRSGYKAASISSGRARLRQDAAP